MIGTINWSGLMKFIEEQKKLNEELNNRLKKVENKLAKLEKKPKKPKS